ncbi:SDR family oxidoreductase [Pedobacter sp. L105]|uniref:SDR family oxidoreductase n=1 Tax=Pedobacter sp. L105 TaxID=1641871 RepID=UPI00131DA79B|nr:SDR family oxidoreductase [Pedobacter sp. L105]
MANTIFITGTSSGLGRLMAIHFAKNGWNVAATMRTPEKETEFNAFPQIKIFKLDVTQVDTVTVAVDNAIAAFGTIDVIVNNAGIGMYGALELTNDADIEKQFAVNVKGVINVIRAFLPHLRANRAGKIINISSLMGISTALPLGSLYNMSKFALEGLTEGLTFELKPLNIDLHLVEPGGFGSAFGENITFSKSEEIKDYDLITGKVSTVLHAASGAGMKITAQPIVDEIYALASGKSKAFRTVVGKDAKMVVFLRKILPINAFLKILGKKFLS